MSEPRRITIEDVMAVFQQVLLRNWDLEQEIEMEARFREAHPELFPTQGRE